MGVAKTCTVCGMTGHNRRTCPMITESQVRLGIKPLCCCVPILSRRVSKADVTVLQTLLAPLIPFDREAAAHFWPGNASSVTLRC